MSEEQTKIVYHWCAEYQTNDGVSVKKDGVTTVSEPITSSEAYFGLKNHVRAELKIPNYFVFLSLSVVGAE